MAVPSLFITGTDTGVGKTRTAVALLHAARAQGWHIAGYKPVASGAEATTAGLRNDDALALHAAMGGDLPYGAVNPYCFAPPIAPHIAAADLGVRIDRTRLDAAHAALAASHDAVLIEGAGGWLVPLNDSETFADWVAARDWPVLLVVALRLGCLNHALLSAEAILRRTRLAGWIATKPPPVMDRAADTLAELQRRLPAPYWGLLDTDATALRGADTAYLDWLAQERAAAARAA